MRNRHTSSFDFHIHPDALWCMGLLGALIAIVIYVPPLHIAIVFTACVIASGAIYMGIRQLLSPKTAFLCATASGLTTFLYLSSLLDLINGIILVCFLVSLGILMHQK